MHHFHFKSCGLFAISQGRDEILETHYSLISDLQVHIHLLWYIFWKSTRNFLDFKTISNLRFLCFRIRNEQVMVCLFNRTLRHRFWIKCKLTEKSQMKHENTPSNFKPARISMQNPNPAFQAQYTHMYIYIFREALFVYMDSRYEN